MSDFLARLRKQIGNELLILPTVTASVFDDQGRMLMALHRDFGDLWAVPGGTVEPDESPAAAVVREAEEEMGVLIGVRGLIGAYGGPLFRTTYPNGDQICFVTTIYGCEVEGGTLRPDGVEVADARWVTETEALALRMPAWSRQVIPDCYAWWRASRAALTPE
ncbi:NUDIX domain-containing protein [Sphaerisporangium corydalis]|uniref:NUDIX domain-containing protein n=1 Tax=Sphaerisporangium corydalis TaxID=1441875 RepID=A0ABV9ENC8_9ACTN|nr:NUDIX domain-containing protein [Sphaerisporangium corydalis]